MYTLHIIDDSTYSIQTNLKKNWKTKNFVNMDKIRYDFNMNKNKVVIKNAFGSLKNKWRILKHLNSRVDRAKS
jgi:hypothetical protein